MLSQSGASLKSSQYRRLGLVGQGQFGQVYCAVHRQTGRLVALKNLEKERFPTRQFLRELRFLLSLRHPNIVTCYALEHTRTGRYLVMDYCEGGTLRSLMVDGRHLTLRYSVKLVMDILMGLEHAHKQGIVHCDIKPENILLSLRSDGWLAKISDFGIARLNQEYSRQHAGNTGSPAYMAPERFYGQYSPTADLYSVGILLFELIAGRRPFSGTPVALMSAHLNQAVEFPERIPATLRPIIQKSLQKLSARRYQSATEMLADLGAIATTAGWDFAPEARSPVTMPPLMELETLAPVCQLTGWKCEPLQYAANQLVFCSLPVRSPSVLPFNEGQHKQAGLPPHLFYASAHRVAVRPLLLSPTAEMGGAGCIVGKSWQITHLPEPVQQLLASPVGCFALTRNAVYRLEPHGDQDELVPYLVHQLEQDCVATIDARGRWLAAVADLRKIRPQTGFSTLQFYPLLASGGGKLASHPIRLANAGASSELLRIVALDSRHVAVISECPRRKSYCRIQDTRDRSRHVPCRYMDRPNESHAASDREYEGGDRSLSPGELGTHIEVVTRRGTRLGALYLPILLKAAIKTDKPYQLLAVDRQDSHSILVIDLKPFRVARIPVEIEPHFLMTTPWGYLVMDEWGQMLILDRDGYGVNRVEGPTGPTAIALMDDRHLWVASQNKGQTYLHGFDLKEMGVDLLL
ncbi:MAG: serine/threonine-protein kinase [Synechococcales bacterium]|nr:serine/threonine-protein kinase [Synechococcales bacterium]